ncbi:MAG: DUF411 domain-containing protein [Thermoplasmata archaeon]
MEITTKWPRKRSRPPERRPSKGLVIALLVGSVLAASLITYGVATWLLATPGSGEPPADLLRVDVYLQPTCGCCHQYVTYLESEGFHVVVHETTDLTPIKDQHGIPASHWACHTATVGGYFVEGHVPKAAIEKLLEDRPAIDGIALPGMPAGSPGMGGVKLGPFVIFAITQGQASVFMEI